MGKVGFRETAFVPGNHNPWEGPRLPPSDSSAPSIRSRGAQSGIVQGAAFQKLRSSGAAAPEPHICGGGLSPPPARLPAASPRSDLSIFHIPASQPWSYSIVTVFILGPESPKDRDHTPLTFLPWCLVESQARPSHEDNTLLSCTQAPSPLVGTFFKGFHLIKGALGLPEV